MTALIGLAWGLTTSLAGHALRVGAWFLAVAIIAAAAGYEPSWRLVGVIVAANVVGCFIYPSGEST